MVGFLDELDRTRLTIDFGQGPLDAIVDTAFTGALLVGEEVFNREAAVAAGTKRNWPPNKSTNSMPMMYTSPGSACRLKPAFSSVLAKSACSEPPC